MLKLNHFCIVSTMLIFTLVDQNAFASEKPTWHDAFFQYRIPVTVKIDKPGWNRISLDEKYITEAINELEEFKYNPDFFAYSYVKLVDVSDESKSSDLEGGFYLIPDGEERVIKTLDGYPGTPIAMFEGASGQPPKAHEKNIVDVPVEPGKYHLLRYVSSDGGSSPALNYEPIFPIGSELRKHGFRISYESRLLPKAETMNETLVLPDSDSMTVRIRGRFITKLKYVSIQKVKILLLVNAKNVGTKRLMLYYQPMCSHYLMVPELGHPTVPEHAAKIHSIHPAEKYSESTRYAVRSNKYVSAWFGESTVKLTPKTSVPDNKQSSIHITSAKNEKQSFQIVLAPQIAFNFKGISATNLKSNRFVIPSDSITFKAVDYVPIRKSSPITPARYLGWIGDPLVPVSARLLSPSSGNHAIWVTVNVPPEATAGTYQGILNITTKEFDDFSLPMELTVYDFALPEFSPFESDMGAFHIHKSIDQRKVVSDYHGVKTKEDLKKLANGYFEEMARNKFTPKNVGLFSEIGMKWDPPPEGYNVDKPGNYFKLHDWDFTEFNRQLDYFINKLKVNQVTIYHVNPKISNVFVHLPGKELEKPRRNHVRHTLTLGWQTFRETTFVGYGTVNKYHPMYEYESEIIKITSEQYDKLLLDFFRAIAKNMDKHGWLDYATIMVDEAHNDEQFLHFLRLLKSDPLVARIKVGVCLQGLSYLYHKENENDDHYAFRGLLDFFIPELCENYNRWEPYFFTDYDIKPARRKLFPYVVTTARSAIDAPGINNRMIGLDVFNRGGGGYLIWDTFVWDHPYSDSVQQHGILNNPWIDPYGRHANGALSFFYPPLKNGSPSEPDFAITPSLRVMAFREAVDDFEYAYILEELIEKAGKQNVDASKAKAALAEISRFFHNSVHWSQNDAWYVDLRDRIAHAIVELNNKLEQKN